MRLRALVFVGLFGCWTAAPAPSTATSPPPTATTKPAVEPIEIAVTVLRWSCTFAYGEYTARDELTVPRGRPLHLTFASMDIAHDVTFSTGETVHVPARVPGAGDLGPPVALDLTLDEPAEIHCPVDSPPNDPMQTTHQASVLAPDAYARWLADVRAGWEAENPTTVEGKVALGKRLVEAKGCIACHTIDGTPRVGPSWLHSWGTVVTGADGSQRKFDDNYVRESILYPRAFARPNYPPAMPAFEGVLKERQLESIIAFIASLN